MNNSFAIEMAPSEHFLFLSSKDSESTHPGNTPHDFTVILPSEMRLEGGGWHCALIQGTFSHSSKDPSFRMMLLLSDLVQESYIRNCFMQLLDVAHHIKRKGNNNVFEIANPLYHPVTRKHIHSVRVTIKDEDTLSECTHLTHPVRCILHLRRTG